MENFILDELDHKILQLITNNARISFLEVARICNVSGGAVHQRVQRMMSNDIITGSVFTINTKKVGFETCAFVSLYFDQSINLDNVVEKIKEIEEVAECHHTIGSYDLLVKIYAYNNSHLHEILQKRFKPLGMIRSESLISYKESFNRQIIVK